MRLSPAVDLEITKFSGTSITQYDAGLTNAIAENMNGITYVSQRPAIDVFEDASTTVSDAKGRGLYYWDSEGSLYFINNNTLYKGTYATVIGAISSGTKRCYFFNLAALMIIIDPENNQGWTVNSSDVLTQITDAQFATTLCDGGAVLDGYFFVMDETGLIIQSDYEVATSYVGTNVIDVEREPDGGVYLAKHHDHLVAFGTRTIEFFYNAVNPTGSILSRRQDIFYNIGCLSGTCVHEQGDNIFFVGMEADGAIGVYIMSNFNVKKISNDSLDSFITQTVVKDSTAIAGSGFGAHGRAFYLITFHQTPSDISPELTLAYDMTSGLWSIFETTVNSLTKFPLIGWSTRTSLTPRKGEGMLYNGDLITIKDDMAPSDTYLGDEYIVSGYIATGYYTSSGIAGTNIAMKCRHGLTDHGSITYKTGQSLMPVIDKTENSQTITIKHANENNASFSAGRTIDVSKQGKLVSLGRYRKRNYHLEYSGDERIRFEGLEIEVERGDI